jgi:hypothetical protein
LAGSQIIQLESLVDFFHSISAIGAFINNYGYSDYKSIIFSSLGVCFMQSQASPHETHEMRFGFDKPVVVTVRQAVDFIMSAIKQRHKQASK